MTDETQLANTIEQLYLQREEALEARRALERELGRAHAELERLRRELVSARHAAQSAFVAAEDAAAAHLCERAAARLRSGEAGPPAVEAVARAAIAAGK